MERKHIQHIEIGDDVRGKGGWYLSDNLVMFRCPNCNMNGHMDDHSVASNGEVNASVACNGQKKIQPTDAEGHMTRVPCDYHEWVILDGWNPQHTKIAGEPQIRS